MTKTRMEGRVDAVEKNSNSIEEMLASMKLDHEQKLLSLKVEQEQRFARIETLITSLVQGKVVTDEWETTARTPTMGDTANMLPIAKALMEDDSALYSY